MPQLPDHIEGVVQLHRSEPSVPPCRCCRGGPHVYSESIFVEPMPSIFAGLKIKSVADWLRDYLSRNRFELEGQRVRIKIEIVDDERDARIERALERLELDERAAAHYPPALVDEKPCAACGLPFPDLARHEVPLVGVVCAACYALAQDLD